MPVTFGTSVISVTYNTNTFQIVVTGEAFADTQYVGVSKIEVSSDGSTWTEVSMYNSWADTQVSGTFASKLTGENYTVRVTSSDGEVATLLNAFTNHSDLVIPFDGSVGYFFFFGGDGK